MENKILHEVAITAIIIKDGKYLITRRSKSKKRFPGMWTVPGGKLETNDYINLEKDTTDYWYNVLERVLRREVLEEVGVEIDNIEYLTSLATVHGDGNPSLVISCICDWVEGEVNLQLEETDDFAWVTTKDASSYDLIDGILDELKMADKKRSGQKVTWSKS